jgi:glyoxylase-like metal-dependent hydrolase (beta-lactamase superfamily II)
MSLYLKQIAVGPMQNFAYLIGDSETKEAAVVDPAWNVPAILHEAQKDGYRVTHVILSHGHYDHINGVEEVVQRTDATVCAEKRELEEFIAEGIGGLVIPRSSLKKTSTAESVQVGKLEIKTIATPGHTPGSQCLWVAGQGVPEDVLVTGDTLFIGTIGRCDFPYSNPRDLFRSLTRIKALSDQTRIYPGHDYGADTSSTLAREKRTNPFLMVRDMSEFLQMVRH